MARFQVVKTISYDLTADVECEADSAEELLDILAVEGDEWLDFEQSDGQDEAIEVFMIEGDE